LRTPTTTKTCRDELYRTILDFENFIFDLGLEANDEEEIITLLESLLVEGQEDQSAKEITYQALKNLIPTDVECEVESGTCYDNLLSKLSDIKWSDDVEYNKTLGSEILATIAPIDPEVMSNSQKLDFKAILTSLVYGWDVDSIPEAEKQEVIDETPDGGDGSSSDGGAGWLKTLLYILLGIVLFGIVVVAIIYILYLIKGKKWSESFRDFADKQWEEDVLSDSTEDILGEASSESLDIFSDSKADDPLAIVDEKPVEKTKPVTPKKESSSATVKKDDTSSLSPEKKEEVPAWLKGNFSEDAKVSDKKTPKEAPKEKIVDQKAKEEVKKEETKTFGQNGKIQTSQKADTSKKTEVPKNKTEDIKTEKKTEEAKLDSSEDNVPDWLKGSFDEKPKTTEKPKEPEASEKTQTEEIPAETPKKEDKKVIKEPIKTEKKTSPKTKKKTITPEKKSPEKDSFDLEWETALPDTDANVPDWLKGSLDESPKAEVKKENTSKWESPKDIRPEAAEKTPAPDTKKTEKSSQDSSSSKDKKEELWDDGMKIPDWLKGNDDK